MFKFLSMTEPRCPPLIAGGILAVLILAEAAFAAQGTASPPNFAPSGDVGWIAFRGGFIRPPSGPGPVSDDPAHPFVAGEVPDPYVPDPVKYTGPVQPTFPIADLNSPILQPWAKEELRKHNERILSGKAAYGPAASCHPAGVPAFLLYGVQPIYFIQGPKEVWMIWQSDHQVRRVHLNQQHSARLKPSWFGESVGHYEGDTLVVDTIGLSDKTFVDNYRTPHTDRLHVVERFHLVDGGKTLQVDLHVEDPGAFTSPWNAIQRYRRVEPGPMIEVSCAENNANYFNQDVEAMPEADKPDF
jgi:hypothetical protein